MSSPSSLISRGIGAWSSVALLITRGLGIGAATVSIMPPAIRRFSIASETRVDAIRAEQRTYTVIGEDRIVEVRNDIQ